MYLAFPQFTRFTEIFPLESLVILLGAMCHSPTCHPTTPPYEYPSGTSIAIAVDPAEPASSVIFSDENVDMRFFWDTESRFAEYRQPNRRRKAGIGSIVDSDRC